MYNPPQRDDPSSELVSPTAASPTLSSPPNSGPKASPERETNAAESSALESSELSAALQLLVERAQYITGATGAALALPQNSEMVCRASTGACAPAVGARLQVRSGLTGESIASRRLLRCDNAESDPRVNLEVCRALGIASIVVLPLLRDGEVCGLFELLSDHPYAFEERDLVALERMADLALTALDLATPPSQPTTKEDLARPQSDSMQPGRMQPTPMPAWPTGKDVASSFPVAMGATNVSPTAAGVAPATAPTPALALASAVSTATSAVPASAPPEGAIPAPLPETMRLAQKCSTCGFPVSQGRTLCLDCEQKARAQNVQNQNARTPDVHKKDVPEQDSHKQQVHHENVQNSDVPNKDAHNNDAGNNAILNNEILSPSQNQLLAAHPDSSLLRFEPSDLSSNLPSDLPALPAFLANAAPFKESWFSNHMNHLLAIAVVLIGAFVVYVVLH